MDITNGMIFLGMSFPWDVISKQYLFGGIHTHIYIYMFEYQLTVWIIEVPVGI